MAEEQKDLYYTRDIPVPETPPAGSDPAPWDKTTIVGTRRSRVDGYERVSGTALYPSDLALPQMLYGAIVRSPYPHCRVRSVDTAAAERLPGVRAVLTDASPEAQVRWEWSRGYEKRLFDPHCRFEGETVAAVAADTPQQARDAATAIVVTYDVLPFVVTLDEAAADKAEKVHDQGNRAKHDTYSRGDMEKGFAAADAVRKRSYSTAAELHTPLELHGCLANWDGESLTIWESTQGVFAVQSKVAATLGLPLSRVRVIGSYLGGGFGSKLTPGKYTIIAALLAKKAARPVKLFLSREETFLAVGNRPPAQMTIKGGVKKDGTLTALEFTGIGTGGAFPAGGTALLDWLVRDLYLCPNVACETTDLFIHGGPARPFRAPGHPQCSWALEQMMDELAEAISMDPVELRLKNIPTVSQGRGGVPYTSTGLEACIRSGAKIFDWSKARKKAEEESAGSHLKRGVGMGSCVWYVGGGGPPSTVILKLFADGSVNLNMGASDIGTGTKTIMAMVAAEELGIRPELIQIENADTGTTSYATPSGGSKTVPTEAPTVRAAAVELKRQLLQWAAEDLGEPVEDLRFEGSRIVSKASGKEIGTTAVSRLKKRGLAVGIGHRGPNPDGKSVNPFAAQFCEVEVNTRTGEVRVLRFVGTNESGRVMNRLTFDNQVFGGIVMGIGLGMTEFRQFDVGQTGKVLNKNWHDYKLPTALDVPLQMISEPVEMPDAEANSAGAKGLGEPVTIPTAGAIANAVYHATGVRITESPLNPLQVMRALSAAQKEA
ncbi:carbon monoxide dehydrogenase, Mo-binding subunit [Desulfuromonas soudanensis]|uniref:Carbon monoxide dehydrogenase, Mo-binding subunit n=1 Tax=Desulfuromonas soudanensis TaxID=1603606 RepID=A0A0M3QFN8_9BACT|nr:xanthine dehydrogenase family protein molybdopterin-binding subunit [Desulfuromonas soudanensis]ALC16393.1 carbon monoxide dehydrogenase, Mo-binding subunit [Desulfuromonas soudanensis]